jgi:NADH-quinone oxidoreductase subunit N
MPANFTAQTLAGMGAIGAELILSVTVIAVIVADLFLHREKSQQIAYLAFAGTVVAFVHALSKWGGPVPQSPLFFSGLVAADSFAVFFQLLILAGTAVAILFSRAGAELWRMRAGEYYALLLTASIAAMLMAASTNLLMLYLAFETLSLPSYILAGYRKDSRMSAEASLKYVLYGAAASAVMLFGISLLYGLAGSLRYDAIALVAAANQLPFFLAMVLVFTGFAFKMSAAPFHFWAPDVYQGAPAPFVAYLSVVSKAAAFAAFMRLLAPHFGVALQPHTPAADGMLSARFDLQSLFWVVAVLTMTMGNFVALRQTDIKRLLAYSSIAHAGYMLTAFVAANGDGFRAILFYFVVYLLMNLGFFLGVVLVNNRTGDFRISSLAGLIHRAPLLAICLAILLVSLIGLPPTAGFVAKWKLFAALLGKAKGSPIPSFYYSLALIAVLNSVVSAYYYMAIIRTMTFGRPEKPSGFRLNMVERAAVLLFAIPILALQLYWTPVSRVAEKAAGGKADAEAAGTAATSVKGAVADTAGTNAADATAPQGAR